MTVYARFTLQLYANRLGKFVFGEIWKIIRKLIDANENFTKISTM